MGRYGGLRCPSEVLSLRWADVDWGRSRMLIRSPKTEHHEGGESRMVPLFPELLPYLREVFEDAEPGSEYVITRYRSPNCNLRTQLQRIIAKAGLKSWPKLFQNLRSTRETELAETWPEHVVCAWIGNSRIVARKHYLQITEEHFERATRLPDGPEEATQNATQQMSTESRKASHAVHESAKCDAKRDPARHCESLVGSIGPEQVQVCLISRTNICSFNQPLRNLTNQPNVVEVHRPCAAGCRTAFCAETNGNCTDISQVRARKSCQVDRPLVPSCHLRCARVVVIDHCIAKSDKHPLSRISRSATEPQR